MKIEKVNENKIRITLNTDDLKEKNIDFQSFMANSIESQDLFLDMLDEAEKKVGFTTKDYKIMIEALAIADGTFILTVTRIRPEEHKDKLKKKINIKRKISNIDKNLAVYSFYSFDDFCNFCNGLRTNIENSLGDLSKHFCLYLYNDCYYLVIKKINLEYIYLKDFYSYITEFGHIVLNSDLFERKLLEYGKVILKNNAIQTCIKHFA